MIKTELYFGQSIGEKNTLQGTAITHEDVTHEQFMAFVDDCITPCFPDGLTILDGVGQWRHEGTSGPIRERCKVVVIIHDGGGKTQDAIEHIRTTYCNRFDQDVVMKVEYTIIVSF